MIDELATRAKVDPIAYRRKLLKPEAKKLRSVLDLLDQQSAGWRSKTPRGRAAGIACHESFDTAVDVSIENRRPKIHRATVAVNCGLAVNPLTIESQFQAGLGFGINIMDAPTFVDVHIVPSGEAPTGCGEPPVPVISPAVVNALSRLTGKRYRSLPLVDV